MIRDWLFPKKSKRMTPDEVEADWKMHSKQTEEQKMEPDARTIFDVQIQLQAVMQHLEKYSQDALKDGDQLYIQDQNRPD